jgi:flagellar biosynthetic protein FliR
MTNILVGDFILLSLVFLRIISAFLSAPIFSDEAFPAIAKIFLAFVIAYIVFLTIKTSSIAFQFNIWWLFLNAIKEIAAGLVIGFSLNFVFSGIQFAGTLIGFDMGLSMAEVLNPGSQAQNNVIGEILYFSAILIFFLIDGHHYLIRALALSFRIVPIGSFTMTLPLHLLLIKMAGSVFIIAVKIASPIMVSFFLIHIAEGIIAKVIPQMQVFFVTQPVKIGAGFLLLVAIAPIYVYVIKNLLKGCEDNLYSIIKAMVV